MKSYGLEMQGPLIIERLSVLPDWQKDFEGRIIYQISDGNLYLATSFEWAKLINETDGIFRKYINNIDATVTGIYSIYEVPSNQMYIVNSLDVIIEYISGVGTMPDISFGILSDTNLFVPSETLKINPTIYSRQIWEKPFGPALQGTNLVFCISGAATYSNFILTAAITGYLVPFTNIGPNTPEPAYKLLYRKEEIVW
jgi:hypothetical protein